MNLFFCYFNNPEYTELARECQKSFGLKGVTVTLIQLDDRHGWMKNCLARPIDLLGQAELHPDAGIGLLDADLTCYKYPQKLVQFDGDIAVHDLGLTNPAKMNPSYRYSAGVCVFGKTALGRQCLKRWAELCVQDGQRGEILREQRYLHDAIEEGKKSGLVVTNIGEWYNFAVPNDVVILHHVESRRTRDKIGGGM